MLKTWTTISISQPQNKGQGWFVVRTTSGGPVKGVSEARVGLRTVLRVRRDQRNFYIRPRAQ